MGKQKEIKTNAMRILESLKIEFETKSYECENFTDGLQIATELNLDPKTVYKTLVTRGNDKQYYVFVIPVAENLDLKKCARSVSAKSVEMIHVSEINSITGYIRGGCTAIGMKKKYVTRIDESAKELEKIYVSGGKIGLQLKLSPSDYIKATDALFADLIAR